jgi:predicted dehydrogenase
MSLLFSRIRTILTGNNPGEGSIMGEKVKWGVMGTAKIAREHVIPSMQNGNYTEITAVASRDLDKAKETADKFGIPKAYGSYKELLLDKEIEAVYIPLPNHLHITWSRACIEAGKHVLCEKPLALSTHDVKKLIRLRNEHNVKVGEAFMVRTHPQWLKTLDMVKSGKLGEVKSIQGFFSYFLKDPKNIRNIPDFGGGAILDIGCYPITTSRFIYGEEPARAISLIDFDPEMKIDRLASFMLDFPSGQAIFTCGTQIVPYQRMIFFGTEKRLEIEIPFNAPNDRHCRIFVDDGDLFARNLITEKFDVCDQYKIHADSFSSAIMENTEVPVPLEDTLHNTASIEAIFRSVKSGKWEKPRL